MSTKILVHAIVTEPGYVDKTAVAGMLAGASQVYSSIGLTFELASLEETSDPVLSKDKGSSVKTSGPPMEIELARTARAARYPGRVVVFFRPVKNNTDYKASNYSSSWGEFIVMAGTSGTDFAHEIGHYLHLGHTHNDGVMNQLYAKNATEGYDAAKKLAAQLIQNAGGLQIFDGDFPAVKDTPPDPGPPLFQPSGYTAGGSAVNPNEHCSGSLSLVVGSKTYVLAPDRANIMSYFKGCPGNHNLSPDQGKIVQAALTSGNRRHLAKGASPEGPAAVVTPAGHIHLFARGDDRNIWHSFWNGQTWSNWQADLGAGTLTSGPAAVVTPAGLIYVFARGDDRNIWHSYWDGKKWSGWQSHLGAGTLTSGPAAVVTPAGLIYVFARGEDRNIWHSYWNGKKWSGWQSHLGAGTLTSGPAAVMSGDQIHVFARGDDRNIWHSYWNGKGWSGWIADVPSGAFMSGLAAVAPSDKILHAFALGDDRGVRHSTRTGQTWSGWAKRGGGTFQP